MTIKLPKFIKLYFKWMDLILYKLHSNKPEGKKKALTITGHFKFCFIIPQLHIFKHVPSNLPPLDCYTCKELDSDKQYKKCSPASSAAAHSLPNRACVHCTAHGTNFGGHLLPQGFT